MALYQTVTITQQAPSTQHQHVGAKATSERPSCSSSVTSRPLSATSQMTGNQKAEVGQCRAPRDKWVTQDQHNSHTQRAAQRSPKVTGRSSPQPGPSRQSDSCHSEYQGLSVSSLTPADDTVAYQCDGGFSDERNMETHETACDAEWSFQYHPCDEESGSKSDAGRNMKSHSKCFPFKSAQSSTAVKQKSCLTDHEIPCGEDRPYTSDKCPAAFKYQNELIKPTKKEKPLVVKSDPGSAPSGNQILNIKEKARDLQIDVSVVEEVLKKRKMVFGKAKQKHFCEICDKGFTQSSSLRTHLAVQHKTVGCKASYPCDICNKAFPSRSTLEAHQSSHTGARPFPCALCGKAYKHKADLRHHITKYHFGSKLFVCDICGNCFTVKGSLNARKLLHEGAKPYECTTCGKAFTQLSTLKKRARIHTGEKPYICQFCGKCFTDRGSVSRHRRKHTCEEPYLCELCSCTFARSEQLKNHMSKDHSGEFQNLQGVADAVGSIK